MWTRCPDAHQLAAFADARLDEASREAITRHLADCDRCLDALALVTRLGADDERPSVPAGLLARAQLLGRRDRRPMLVRWAPALASAALVIIVAGVVLQQQIVAPPYDTTGVQPSGPRDVRTGTERVAAPTVTAPVDEAVLPGAPVRIEWSAMAGAVFYQVRIAAEDGALVWDGRASGESQALVADAAVQPGRRYYVTVTAHGAGDRSVRSRAVGFLIERR